MEHLDLAGVINTPTLWNLSAFDQQDAIYLSSSRQMLEPILEETSEDEEHAQNSWNQYEQGREHFWSSAESETGSVIRVELNKDPDSISERDFACPAKRARRCEDFIIGGQLSVVVQSTVPQPNQTVQFASGSYDDTVLLRRTQRPFDYNEANSNSLERFLAYEASTRDSWGQQQASQVVVQQRNSTGSRRFDEFSDSDSISYHSLSRSSSLIQFESLERQLQLQEQHASMSSLGNSSPSLLSFDGARSTGELNSEDGVRSGGNSGSNSGNNSRRGSQSSLLKRFESSDGRLHQTYFDLDKLNFDDDQRVLFGASKVNLMEATVGEVKSDSESSTSSGSSSGNSILTASKPSAEDLTESSSTAGMRAGRIMAFQRAGKNSAENLSEDSGYCEPSTLRRAKSKSIPNNFEKFCEEEEEFQPYEYTCEARHVVGDIDSITKTTTQQLQHSKGLFNHHNTNINSEEEDDICQPKINDATFVVGTDHENEEKEEETSFNTPPTESKTRPHSLPQAVNGKMGDHAIGVDNEVDVENDFNEEHNNLVREQEANGSSHASHVSFVSASPTYVCAKNSPTREATASASLLEQRRSLAHSPSPVASDISSNSSSSVSSASSGSSYGTARSSTSASTCASTASFTWLPTPRQLQQQQQQLQIQLECSGQRQTTSAKLELVAATQKQQQNQPRRMTLENFCASLRNSLPDIRDALSTTTCNTTEHFEIYFPVDSSEEERKNGCDVSGVNNVIETNGHGLEHLHRSERTKASEHEVIDDSDLNTTSASATTSSGAASSARGSHSDETTDNESTPEARKRQRVYNNAGGGCGADVTENTVISGFVSGCVTAGRRISSVPSELNKLGRRKRVSTRHRQCKTSPEEEDSSPSNSSVDEAENEDDFFEAATSFRIRRSCSWSERRERNLQRFEAAFGDRAQPNEDRCKNWATQSLGYMNASYRDLTQLDYTLKQGEFSKQLVKSNLKRCSVYVDGSSEGERETDSDNMDTPKNTATADYEHIICKGNFLLDELSQIYDRNASILNDKPMEGGEQLLAVKNEDRAAEATAPLPKRSPRPPPRQRKHSNSSYSDLDSICGADESLVATAQHIQLTIRKPPARQKHARKSEDTHSLISDAPLFESQTSTTSTATVAYSKTFDQDPTNLRTSYTQSLEKCNFDAKELSNSELNKTNSIPKRRFHSQANVTKQRNMVSSTPNLNAYDPHADEVGSDMYVSSAHTSMHQLPLATTQKPLGILLPAGSRTSFSKEVSFCPVVSQYSWQEQSSEEYTEQHQQRDGEQVLGAAEKQDETDDELLDNADATVIQNTRVNEMIAARYMAELKSALAAGNATKSVAQIRAVPIEKVKAMIIVREREAAEEQARARLCLQEQESSWQEHCERQAESEDIEKTSHKANEATDYSDETKGEALKLDSNDGAIAESTETYYNSETVCAGVATTVNVSQKSTIIDTTASLIQAEQTTPTTVKSKQSKAVNVSNEPDEVNVSNEPDVQSNRNKSLISVGSGGSSNISASEQTRPLSIQLPILSEPPINRAHHILYASQQLLDNFERREIEQLYQQQQQQHQLQQSNSVGAKCSSVGGVGDRRAKSVGNLSGTAQVTRYRMSNATVGAQSSSGVNAAAANNNNELLNKKFKDEKHPSSKGFLSRFAHGLRFSLRRKNKKQLQQQQQQREDKAHQQHGDGEQNGLMSADRSTMRKSFGTLPQSQLQAEHEPSPTTTSANSEISTTLPANFSPADATKIGGKGQQKPASNNNNTNNKNTKSSATAPVTINSNKSGSDSTMRAITDRNGEPLVTGKPPKPYRYGSIPATTPSTTIITKYFGSGRRQGGAGGVPAHAQNKDGMPNAANFKSRSQFYTDFLDAERSYYNDDEIEKQLDAGLQANGSAVIEAASELAAKNIYNGDDEAHSVKVNREQQQQINQQIAQQIAVTTPTRSYNVEYETPSSAQQSAQIAYSVPGVTRDTVMLLTGSNGANGATVSGSGETDATSNGRIVAPTYTTMSNAYLQHINNNSKIGLIETNLDTHETVISGKTRSLVDIVGPQHHQHQQQYGGVVGGGAVRRLNMNAIGGANADLDTVDDDDVNVYGRDVSGGGGGVVIKSTTANGSKIASVRRPHKSMEFLLDKENQKNVLPPENELQKSHDHNPATLSEHQLRVQASLQRLNIPEWFRQYNQNTSRSPEGGNNAITVYKPGNFTRKRITESGRWAGLNSKTTSLSSLGSQRSDRSPLLLSPSAHSHHGGQGAQHQQVTAGTASAYGASGGGSGAGVFSRWSTSHLNSSQTSPSVSQRGSFTRGGPINSSFISVASGQSSVIRSSYRQPYLGWRSQEKLSQRTPHERLASSLLAQQQRTSPTQKSVGIAGVTTNGGADNGGSKLQPVTPEIQSSIKEVTSAIVHYVNDQTQQQQRSRSASPNSRKCWLESSFVGIRPLDSPQTPIIENTTTAFSSATNTNNNNTTTNNSISSSQYNNYNYNYNTSNSSSNTLTAITTPNSIGGIGIGGSITTAITTNPHVLRMNGLSIVGGGESTIMI